MLSRVDLEKVERRKITANPVDIVCLVRDDSFRGE